MDSSLLNDVWIWHPDWKDEDPTASSAGALVHFRKSFFLNASPRSPVRICITADTRYKLYINGRFVHYGPVKGDENMWFYDELDIRPYLTAGANHIGVRVLRFYHATTYAQSFSRMPFPGLLIRPADEDYDARAGHLGTNDSWETALDRSTSLPVNQKEDSFLNVYEQVNNSPESSQLHWMPAKCLEFRNSFGLAPPWVLSPRMIPPLLLERSGFVALHNVRSTVSLKEWKRVLLVPQDNTWMNSGVRLPPGTTHHLELEASRYLTAFLSFRFRKPIHGGSIMRITYSECYEDEPVQVPFCRIKGDRRDTSKSLLGPHDEYVFGSIRDTKPTATLYYHNHAADEDIFAPFHFRTLKYISMDIHVATSAALVFNGVDLVETRYPLDVQASFDASPVDNSMSFNELWSVSVRTLQNCMHECYEDCPFYEQLQYAMDARSSALFTYVVSNEDRLSRQAIVQFHNSYRPRFGLIASRCPSSQHQIIPNFSLFWICMITDHFDYYADVEFIHQFVPVCDAILETFSRQIDTSLGLLTTFQRSTYWEFIDWTPQWAPMGTPPAGVQTGVQTFTNFLYAYTLRKFASIYIAIGRPHLCHEYQARAEAIVQAARRHCFDGQFFTDGLSSSADFCTDYSQHNQIWAVLCGAVRDEEARVILLRCLTPALAAESASGTKKIVGGAVEKATPNFTETSTAMSFYTLRAMSMVDVYDDLFHAFWEPWRRQLALNLTTWLEDSVNQRSDCHAWGSAPLYEFTAEVCGIRPAEPGWEILEFKPRVALLQKLDAKVPFGGRKKPGVAHIRWCRTGSIVDVALFLELKENDARSPIRLIGPDGALRLIKDSERLQFRIEI